MAGDHEVVAGELMVDGQARGFALLLPRVPRCHDDRYPAAPAGYLEVKPLTG